MILKKISVIFRISLLLIIIFAISSASYFLINRIQKNITHTENTITVINRNDQLLAEIITNSEKILTQKKDAKNKLIDIVHIFDFTFPVLKNGGTPPAFGKDIRIQAITPELLPVINEIETEWLQSKPKIEIIIKEPVYTITRETSDTANITNSSTKIFKNHRVFNSVTEIEKSFEKILQKNKQIKQYYSDKKENQKNTILIILIIETIFLAVLLILIYYILKNKIFKPANQINNSIQEVLDGRPTETDENQEFQEYKNILQNLNKIYFQQKKISEFVINLKNNNLDIKIENYNKHNTLETSLIELRDKLKEKLIGEEKRNQEEKQNQWAVEGQAKFNEILRNSATNLDTLADNVIKNIVKFLDASLGGIFILNKSKTQEPYLELLSAFAYDRKKYLTKTIPIGEGLIGMCALEQNTVWINNLPRNYIEIESGLGESKPGSLLIIPLKTDYELLGVIEMGSFRKFQKYEVEFVEKIARNIAATIETTKISERTTELLAESQKKSEELTQRDNEMTLKIDELRKTQEEAIRKEAEIENLISAVDKTLLKAELTPRAKILSINDYFANKTNSHPENIKNKSFSELMTEQYASDFSKILTKISEGKVSQVTQEFKSGHEKTIFAISQYTPVKDEKGEIIRILFLGNDITTYKETEEKNKNLLKETLEKTKLLTQTNEALTNNIKQLQETKNIANQNKEQLKALTSAIDTTLIKLEFNLESKILNFNYRFSAAIKCTDQEIIENKINVFLPDEINKEYDTIIEKLQNGQTITGNYQLTNKKDEKIWWKITLTPVKDENNTIYKILMIAKDTTTEKKAEEKIKLHTNSIQEQEEIKQKNTEEKKQNEKAINQELAQLQKEKQQILEKFETQKDKKYYEWLKKFFNK